MKVDDMPIEELKERFQYAPNSGIFTNRIDQRRARRGQIAGVINKSTGYVILTHYAKKFRAHRVAWAFVHGRIPDGMLVDHVNGDKTDNRISNLRLATKSQNAVNTDRLLPRDLPKGVYKTTKGKKPFMACIMVNRKTRYLGAFDDPEEAASTYRKAAQETFGNFTRMARR